MVERPSFSTTKVLYNSLLILSHLVHSDNSSRPVCSGDSEFILNIMTTKLFLKFIDKFEDNFDDNLLPLEVLKDKISNGREIREGHTSGKKTRLCWLVMMTDQDKSQILH